MKNSSFATNTMAISNCLFSPTSENPYGFSVWVCTCKVPCQPTQLLIAGAVTSNVRKNEKHKKNNFLIFNNDIYQL